MSVYNENALNEPLLQDPGRLSYSWLRMLLSK